MEACSQCPHPNDCLKVGSCLDDLNARYLAEHRNQFPRLMTSTQANIFMARLRAGESVRRMTSGSKKVGKALVPPGFLGLSANEKGDRGAVAFGP